MKSRPMRDASTRASASQETPAGEPVEHPGRQTLKAHLLERAGRGDLPVAARGHLRRRPART